MIYVNLKNQWFGPDAATYRPVDNPHEFPDEFEDLLPSSAKVLTGKEAKAAKEIGEVDVEAVTKSGTDREPKPVVQKA